MRAVQFPDKMLPDGSIQHRLDLSGTILNASRGKTVTVHEARRFTDSPTGDGSLRIGATEIVTLWVAHPSVAIELLNDPSTEGDEAGRLARPVMRLDVEMHGPIPGTADDNLREADLERRRAVEEHARIGLGRASD